MKRFFFGLALGFISAVGLFSINNPKFIGGMLVPQAYAQSYCGSGTPVMWGACVNSSTVASLPSCTVSLTGALYLVTDALLPSFLGSLTGGGAVKTLAVCTGSTWIAA